MRFTSAAALASLAPLAAAGWGPVHGGPPHGPQSWSWGPPKSAPACTYPSAASPTAPSSASPTSIVAARPSCVVNGLGAGGDDGPNILAAFQQCNNGGRVVLADYYSVDTLLLATGLNNIEIELSGTREYACLD